MRTIEPIEQVLAIAGDGNQPSGSPVRLEISRLEEREVVRKSGEIDRPWTEVRLDVYPDGARVVMEMSRHRRGSSPEAIGLMLNIEDAKRLLRVITQAVRACEGIGTSPGLEEDTLALAGSK